MQKRKLKIESERDYNATIKKIDALMKVGEGNLTDEQVNKIRGLSLAAQAYEQAKYLIPAPTTLEGIIALEMYERKLKQNELAKLLGVWAPKLSQILVRKRKADVAFLKAVHKKLNIDASKLLEYA